LGALACFALGRIDHGPLKAAWIHAVMGGSTRAEVESWNAHFIPRLLDAGLYADARAAIERHRSAGDTLVLLSASPDLYVPTLARALGFTECLCTGVRWRGDILDGRLTTANRRGPEKARCLELLRQRHPQLPIVAYGNAAADLEHLSRADRGMLVNGSRTARQEAARLGLASLRWH
jgi:phosphatidylglycerophosphatase C